MGRKFFEGMPKLLLFMGEVLFYFIFILVTMKDIFLRIKMLYECCKQLSVPTDFMKNNQNYSIFFVMLYTKSEGQPGRIKERGRERVCTHTVCLCQPLDQCPG